MQVNFLVFLSTRKKAMKRLEILQEQGRKEGMHKKTIADDNGSLLHPPLVSSDKGPRYSIHLEFSHFGSIPYDYMMMIKVHTCLWRQKSAQARKETTTVTAFMFATLDRILNSSCRHWSRR